MPTAEMQAVIVPKTMQKLAKKDTPRSFTLANNKAPARTTTPAIMMSNTPGNREFLTRKFCIGGRISPRGETNSSLRHNQLRRQVISTQIVANAVVNNKSFFTRFIVSPLQMPENVQYTFDQLAPAIQFIVPPTRYDYYLNGSGESNFGKRALHSQKPPMHFTTTATSAQQQGRFRSV